MEGTGQENESVVDVEEVLVSDKMSILEDEQMNLLLYFTVSFLRLERSR